MAINLWYEKLVNNEQQIQINDKYWNIYVKEKLNIIKWINTIYKTLGHDFCIKNQMYV